MKKILFVTTLLAFLMFSAQSAFAESQTTSNTVQTKVGTTESSQLPQKSGDILSWATQISNALETGFDGAFDRMTASISNGNYTTAPAPGSALSNIYWCTYLIADAFNLAGIGGLSRSKDAAVVNMIRSFKTTPSLRFLDYYNSAHSQILSQVKPGYAIFYQASPGSSALGDLDHVAIIKTININQHGDGQIETVDANISGGRKTLSYTVDGWDIKWRTSPVVGFGTAQ